MGGEIVNRNHNILSHYTLNVRIHFRPASTRSPCIYALEGAITAMTSDSEKSRCYSSPPQPKRTTSRLYLDPGAAGDLASDDPGARRTRTRRWRRPRTRRVRSSAWRSRTPKSTAMLQCRSFGEFAVVRPEMCEPTALGSALLAGRGGWLFGWWDLARAEIVTEGSGGVAQCALPSVQKCPEHIQDAGVFEILCKTKNVLGKTKLLPQKLGPRQTSWAFLSLGCLGQDA
ncbi:hypothetical protein GGX14DRAFT_604686 [Mycena pura]|uniref:Uncharacterized protein n=1 Tax=Mycena pura TaxID=153505 RepID=A0AAD6VQC0_9AGAR|nr:hypothetical protein GGX14DRAFT_604686 [Mycena pura]